MNPVARLSQLFTRWLTFLIFGLAGLVTGETLSSQAQVTLSGFAEAIALALAGLVTFLIDLWLHRLQKEKRS
jgi:hypothetical protein